MTRPSINERNKRALQRKYGNANKTANQVNIYNSFLESMDKKQREQTERVDQLDKIVNKTDDVWPRNQPITHDANSNQVASKDHIDLILKKILEKYTDFGFNNEMFNGTTHEDNIISKMETNNPNLYENNPKDSSVHDDKELANAAHILLKIREKHAKTPPLNIERIATPNIEREKVDIDVEIAGLDDLLTLINDYPDDVTKEYNINITALHKIKGPLNDLNNMVGMKKLKESVVDQIIYYLQDFHKPDSLLPVSTNVPLPIKAVQPGDTKPNFKVDQSGGGCCSQECNKKDSKKDSKKELKIDTRSETGDFMHTVIYGSPGTGKTEIAKIIGQIFSNLGVLSKGSFKKVTRSDLVAGYLGQTALKTRDVIKEALGGVLFIDEAYALGNSEKRDSFSKECIDTLCEALSDHKADLMVIIAGYEGELNECFFNYNQGLNSRFTWRYKTDDYTAEDMCRIFTKKIADYGWEVAEGENINPPWFEKKMDYFKYYGRDIETLLAKIKIAHSRRVFCKSKDTKKKLTMKDLEKGFEIYLKNEEVKSRKENAEMKTKLYGLYV